MRHTLLMFGVLGTLLAGVATAHAQPQGGVVAPDTPLPISTGKTRGLTKTPSAWEFEVHGGRTTFGGGLDGTASLPSTGALSQGIISASTLYAGTGASLFNANGLGTIVPLDAVLTAGAVRRVPDALVGARLYRRIKGRLGLEFGGDYSVAPFGLQPSAVAAVEATRSSYQVALSSALARGGVGSEVSSVSTVVDRPTAQQLIATASVLYHLPGTTRLEPYVAAGGGVAVNYGTLPSITLTGISRLGTAAQVTYTDNVAVNFSQNSHSPIYQGAAGFKLRLTRHLGIRGDARLQLLGSSVKTSVDLSPTLALRSAGGSFPQLSAGTLRYGIAGPLTGATIVRATTFTGSGFEQRFVATGGLYLRF